MVFWQTMVNVIDNCIYNVNQRPRPAVYIIEYVYYVDIIINVIIVIRILQYCGRCTTLECFMAPACDRRWAETRDLYAKYTLGNGLRCATAMGRAVIFSASRSFSLLHAKMLHTK